MSKVRHAVIFSVLTQHSIQIISLVSIAIIARLLTPAEIGVFAVASSVTFLAIELRSLGIGQYLIRESSIDDEKIRRATGLMILVSWALAGIIIISAPVIARFYSEPALTYIFWIIAGTFILSPFSSVPYALLTRDMQFDKLFNVKLTSSLVRSGSTIVYILYDYSYYGLAMGTLTGAIAEFLAITYYRDKQTPWLPLIKDIKQLINFGVLTSSANILQRFAQGIPDLVLGKVASMLDVGLFSRGFGLVLFVNKMIIMAVQPTVLPHLSEVKRAEKSIEDAYMKAATLQCVFSLPVLAVVNLAAEPMIFALFGNQWGVAVPIASILAIWAMLISIHGFLPQALLAVHHEKIMFWKELSVFIFRLIAIIVTSSFGLVFIAWGLVLSGLFELLISVFIVQRVFKLSVWNQIQVFLPTLFVTIFCWISLWFIFNAIDMSSEQAWYSLLKVAFFSIICWALLLKLSKHQAWTILCDLSFAMSKKITQN